MNSVNFPPLNEPKPLAQLSRTVRLPRIVLNKTKLESLLALRSKRKSNKRPPSVNERTKSLPNTKVDHARAGPCNAMNVIDLTADNDDDDDDDQFSELSPSIRDDNIYDDDPLDDAFEEDVFFPAPEQRPQANIAPDVNGYAVPAPAPAPVPAPVPQAIHRGPPHRPLVFDPPALDPDQQANPFDAAYAMGDFILDDDFDDENFARAYEQLYQPPDPQAPAPQPHAEPSAIVQPQAQAQAQAATFEPVPQLETEDECIAAVLGLFPDICPDHVSELWNKVSRSSDQLIAHILDKMENNSPYTKAKDKQKALKRKREIDEDEAAELKYGAPGHVVPFGIITRTYIKNILQVEFPETPMVFIYAALDQSQHRLFQAYRILEEAQRAFNPADPPYNKIKNARKSQAEFKDSSIQAHIVSPEVDPARKDILRELQAARSIRSKAEAKRELESEAEREEEANEQKAIAEGTMQECGCCFGDCPFNRMVHCDADTMHWFCKACAKQTADTEIGNSKYILRCMSMDGCEGGFSLDQRSLFLDEKTQIALERNEQEAVLRMAGIENLESCPFCPYAAEYPPVEVNKEFRCEAPDCERLSCRLCKLESHIPKSCDEFMKDNGLSIRRQVEEAMSAALIRKCNKCGTPFVKDEGCNKMTCTRNGCHNVQCYVCSESCSYNHFDDQNRGGRKGNCPLFESTFERHDIDVGKAAKEAIDKVRAEHPEYTEEDLKVHMSENVLKDDEQRKQRDPRAHLVAAAQMRLAGQ
ncbi:E3 ubiquitin-protein ligase [Lachnellula hyalina]|uniref:E3 ubiquitin-protein ligase n=1 Tax=Lachnellula hyalina TaxID=1316788 RepID=A0A8H8R7W2_9HELO|nr:E3 ubiquitin-protein ligase [Lachnellula hyalina]TVY30199.1 E3 ubiquitin-protein ligase [Lachnellula hyalina]